MEPWEWIPDGEATCVPIVVCACMARPPDRLVPSDEHVRVALMDPAVSSTANLPHGDVRSIEKTLGSAVDAPSGECTAVMQEPGAGSVASRFRARDVAEKGVGRAQNGALVL